MGGEWVTSPSAYATLEGSKASGAPSSSEFFGQLFPKLPSFAANTSTVRSALLEVGAKGGIMDAGDDLAAGPVALISRRGVDGNPTESNRYGSNPDNPTNTAGTTFFGQFIDHDITFDQTSSLGVPQEPEVSLNSRTPALDLDSVFGGGPKASPHLYVANSSGGNGPRLLIGSGGVFEDVPRVVTSNGGYRALLGDPRNDQTSCWPVSIAAISSSTTRPSSICPTWTSASFRSR